MGGQGPVWLGAVIAALITVIATATGWFMSVRREQRRRLDKLVDQQRALSAEIRTRVMQYEQLDFSEEMKEIAEQIQADPNFVPFVLRQPELALYKVIGADIFNLPTNALEPVVLFYSHLEFMRIFAEDLRSQEFKSLDQSRRLQLWQHWVNLNKRALVFGQVADAALLNGMSTVSSPAAARSGPARER